MHKPNITANKDGSFYALVVRIDSDGEQSVLNHYQGRYFKSLKAAQKSTSNYIEKYCS